MDVWKKSFPTTKDSQCKGPEAETAWCVLGTAGSLHYSILIAASQASSP